jgi:magnesium and cobalt transporter
LDNDSESFFSQFLGRLFRGKSHISLEKLILEAKEEGEVSASEVAMLLNILRLGRKGVSEIMIPRPDIVCAEIGQSVPEIVEMINSSGHSRIPIYRKSRDHIVGIVHAKDLLGSHSCEELRQKEPQDFMRLPLYIPDNKSVLDMLQHFRTRRTHLAIAQDEYGGTSGMVTFEDVLEEIVGEIEDEYDLPRPEEIQVLENRDLLVSGRTQLDELEDRLGMDFESEQVETISGYLCSLAGRVPRPGETYDVQSLRFLVKEADNKQIHWLVITEQQGNQEGS